MTCALGLGEAGEVQDIIKKHYYHGHTMPYDKLIEELGDLLWYLACLAHLYGINLDLLMVTNIQKLEARYPDGFSKERSINRER